MSAHETRTRVLSPLVEPLSLPEGGSYRSLAGGAFGIAELEDLAVTAREALVSQCRQKYAQNQSAGVVPGTKMEAVFFDMDSTVIGQESIVELARGAGQAEEVSRVTERAMRGELDFEEALRERVALLEGVPETIFEEVAGRLTLNPGIEDFAAFCRQRGVPLFMVSGGFVPLARSVQQQVGLTDIFANHLEVREGKLTGRVEGQVVDGQAKKDWVLDKAASLGVEPARVCTVGDGANDAVMMKACGMAVGFRPKPVLHEVADAVIGPDGDHRLLGALLFGEDLF